MRRSVTTFFLPVLLTLALSGPAAAIDSFFDVFTEVAINAPPYPTAPIITIVGEQFGPVFVPEQEHSTSVADIKLNQLPPGEPVIGTLSAHGGGTGGLPPGLDSFFDVFIDLDFPQPMTGSMRRISDIRIVHTPGTPPGNRLLLLPINPGAPPGSIDSFFDVFVDDSFFDITYRVQDPGGYHDIHESGMSPSHRMSFFDVFVEIPLGTVPDSQGRIPSFFDVFVDFGIIGPRCPNPPCPIDPNDVCFRTTGSRTSDPVPVISSTWSGIKSLLD